MLWEQSCARIMPSIEIALAMATVAKLNRIWRCNTISFASKFKLYKPLVTPILLYGCETWTLLAGSEKKEKRSRLSKPSARGNLSTQLAWFGHITRPAASPNPSFRVPWRVGNAVVGRGNAGWTTSKGGHPCPCQNCSQGPSVETT